MPSPRHHDPGNLYIRLNVKFPETLTPEQMAGLEKSLPPRRALPKPPAKLHIEEVTLQEPSERQKMQNDPDAMDEDDEDESGPRAGVQCAQRESPALESHMTEATWLTILIFSRLLVLQNKLALRTNACIPHRGLPHRMDGFQLFVLSTSCAKRFVMPIFFRHDVSFSGGYSNVRVD